MSLTTNHTPVYPNKDDDTRVVLNNERESYVHATYITGYYKYKEYIATQGHRSQTVEDLWRMIWQEKANRIVMMCNIQENGKQRCEQYWPKDVRKVDSWGEFTITTIAEDVCADYVNRVLTLTKGTESRTIYHFHFTTWEDKKLPINGAMTLFTFHKKVHSFDKFSKAPLVVHCSAGIGRTGSFIALDILINQAREENQVDIYKCVTKLREQRMLMVQTEDQYFFLHDALVDYTKSGDTSYACNNFEQVYNSLCSPQSAQKIMSDKESQFKVVMEMKAQLTGHEDGLTDENKEKNRDLSIIPDDNHRPHLKTYYKDGTDYINAVFVPSYKIHGYYIVTQMPLLNTVVDFWRLVYDHNCHTIVMLDDMDVDDSTCVPYWPDEQESRQQYGPLDVTLTETNFENTNSRIITRDFVVQQTKKQNKGKQSVRQFQLLSWNADAEFPPTWSDMLDLMEMVLSWQQQQQRHQKKENNPKHPPDKNQNKNQQHVLVHCMDGASRSGLYCGASYVLDKMKVEQEVDVYLAARLITRNRPAFISNLAQYTFLYEMALEYMQHHSEYANFQ